MTVLNQGQDAGVKSSVSNPKSSGKPKTDVRGKQTLEKYQDKNTEDNPTTLDSNEKKNYTCIPATGK